MSNLDPGVVVSNLEPGVDVPESNKPSVVESIDKHNGQDFINLYSLKLYSELFVILCIEIEHKMYTLWCSITARKCQDEDEKLHGQTFVVFL